MGIQYHIANDPRVGLILTVISKEIVSSFVLPDNVVDQLIEKGLLARNTPLPEKVIDACELAVVYAHKEDMKLLQGHFSDILDGERGGPYTDREIMAFRRLRQALHWDVVERMSDDEFANMTQLARDRYI